MKTPRAPLCRKVHSALPVVLTNRLCLNPKSLSSIVTVPFNCTNCSPRETIVDKSWETE